MNSANTSDLSAKTTGELMDLGEAATISRSVHDWTRWLICALAFGWSLFQLYLAYRPINSIVARSIHLTFGIVLVYLSFPIRRGLEQPAWVGALVRFFGRKHAAPTMASKIPWYDFLLAVAAGCGAAYMAWDYEGIIERSGLPLERDVYIGAAFIIFLLEAARRSLGLALPVLASVFLLYCFAGRSLPRFLAHPGVPLDFVVDHMYLTDSGIWGVPLGVSTDFVFLFVLFGALLERAGAAEYFVQVAFAAVGRFRGGPAKAAVLASGLTGMVSGSSIANVATTGTFTIPLMKRVGLPAFKAAAVEVAASTNGQLLPPVMGAAAFIMAEFLGLPYVDIVTAAAIPAILSYVALLYVVHLEALKLDLRALPKEELPRFWPTFARGVHFLIPLAALIYTLVVLRFSAVSAAFNAIILTLAIMVAQRPVQACAAVLRSMPKESGLRLRRLLWPPHFQELDNRLWDAFLQGLARAFGEICQGFVSGARNMAPIAVATAAAGIIVGTVTLTGLSSRFIEAIEIISLGNVILMLLLTALTSLILGMGLPTTANYIVMATLTAPVIVALGAKADLAIPALAAHLFVFYFGILADDTPPVGLAAFAASAIAASEPIKTGIQGFTYDLRTAILPFVFIFNLELLLIAGLDNNGRILWLTDPLRIVWVIVISLVAILAFAACIQGYFGDRCRWVERLALGLVCLLAFRPDLFAAWSGLGRMGIQFTAALIFCGLYAFQKRRRAGPTSNLPAYG